MPAETARYSTRYTAKYTARYTARCTSKCTESYTQEETLSKILCAMFSREDTEIAEMPRRDGQESNYFESEFQMKPEMKSIWMAIVSRNLCDDAECIQKQQEINCLIELRVFEQQIDE